MTLDQLRIFVAVAELRHVTRAAKALHLSQSAVSAAIAALETQHDVRLFDRVGRGIDLTEAGATFLGEAKALLAQAETATVLLEDLAQAPRGRLRIHASQTVASYWLPPRLMALHDRHPEVRISLKLGNTAEAAAAVAEGAADLGFVEGDPPQSALRRQVVARDELALILAADHPAAGQESFSAEDYRAFRWLMREPGSGTRSEMAVHLRRMGLALEDLEIALELPSNEAVLAAVAASRCAAMLSRRAAAGALGPISNLAVRPVTWTERPTRPFAVLSHPDRHRTRAVQAMLDIVLGARSEAQG